MVTAVITSFNRPDLLYRNISSLLKFCKGEIRKLIIIEDSGDLAMKEWLLKSCSNYTLIINEKNIGAYESIDLVYADVCTPYVLHIEDDWEFTEGGFIEPAIKVLEHDKSIMQVTLEHNPLMSTLPEILNTGGVNYQIVGEDINGWWHGFTCHPSVRSMAGYEATKPWTQWSSPDEELSQRELKVGLEYFRIGYKAAILEKSYCIHTGLGRCTWHPNE